MQEVTFSNPAEEAVLLPADAVESAENNLAADPEETDDDDDAATEEEADENTEEAGDEA